MDEMVTVSLLGQHSFRPGKGQPTVNYKMGIQQMPIEHARGMGLMHRIVKTVEQGDFTAVQQIPLEGRFDEKLTNILTGAGYATLTDLAKAERNELTAIDGIGPAAYEKIQAVLYGQAAG